MSLEFGSLLFGIVVRVLMQDVLTAWVWLLGMGSFVLMLGIGASALMSGLTNLRV